MERGGEYRYSVERPNPRKTPRRHSPKKWFTQKKIKYISMLSKFANEDSSLNMPGIAKVWTVEDEDFL